MDELVLHPSLIACNISASLKHPAPIRGPAVRRSFLEKGSAWGGRGAEPFVKVDWDAALDLVAAEVGQVRATHGNAAILGSGE